MNKKKYQKWKQIRQQGILLYILKYVFWIGLLVPTALVLLDMLNGFLEKRDFLYYREAIIIDLKYKLPIFITISVLSSFLLWILNERIFHLKTKNKKSPKDF